MILSSPLLALRVRDSKGVEDSALQCNIADEQHVLIRSQGDQ